MEQIKNIIGFSLGNVIVFYFSSRFFGAYLVFGNVLTNPLTATILTAIVVALIAASVGPTLKHYKVELSPGRLMIVYYVVNSAALYILARTPISHITAIGISVFWVALVLGFVVNFVQYGIWILLSKIK